MTIAIAFSCFAIGIVLGAFMNETEQFRCKYRARVPKSQT